VAARLPGRPHRPVAPGKTGEIANGGFGEFHSGINEFGRIAPGTNKIDHLTAELRRVSGRVLGISEPPVASLKGSTKSGQLQRAPVDITAQ
jgi:hypothetical protein